MLLNLLFFLHEAYLTMQDSFLSPDPRKVFQSLSPEWRKAQGFFFFSDRREIRPGREMMRKQIITDTPQGQEKSNKENVTTLRPLQLSKS